jgi:putative FmdB family regulatory protein
MGAEPRASKISIPRGYLAYVGSIEHPLRGRAYAVRLAEDPHRCTRVTDRYGGFVLNQWLQKPKIPPNPVRMEAIMPYYEYFCHACKKPFSKMLNPAEYEEGIVACPYCSSEEVEQRMSAFYPISSRDVA